MSSKIAIVCFLILVSLSTQASSPDSQLLGFFQSSNEAERRAESAFLAVPSPQKARQWLQRITEEPHVAGTPGDRALAEYLNERFKEFGFSSEIVEYQVYINYPKSASLKMTVPAAQDLSLQEAGIAQDKDSYSTQVFPAFHGYGASGKANGQVVYANYGTVEDFNKLEKMGVPVKGKIALIRYGRQFRGLKVREAQERGAAGVIIYSDPADDGYMKGDVYPQGPMRPESSLQRGSVAFNSEYAGDPTTPGWASKKGARRLDASQLRLAKIPSVPLSYGEASKILKALAGANVPEGWQGGLPFAYHVGPGPAELEMQVEMDYAIRPIWDVLATIPGSAEKDRLVILGNHYDAWSYGAEDPGSGTATLLETARGLAAAYKAGWRPLRTIQLSAWDGEEYGLLGSTEWGEDHADELSRDAVTYINCDSAASGPNLDVSGVPSLRDLVVQVARDVADPISGKAVFDGWNEQSFRDWASSEPVVLDKPDKQFYLNLDPLGSGSDYTVFLDHLGIPSLSFSFNGPYGVYHSAYDSFYWMEHFGDPNFQYEAAASRFFGLLAMRLAGADLLPVHYHPYAARLADDLDSIRRNSVMERRTARLSDGNARAPLQPDFGPVLAALQQFTSAADELDAALDRIQQSGTKNTASLAELNGQLAQMERRFLDPDGLPKRSWFRHLIIGPGFTTGYAPWPFPGITQAMKDRDASLYDVESRRIIARLSAAADCMRSAAEIAKKL